MSVSWGASTIWKNDDKQRKKHTHSNMGFKFTTLQGKKIYIHIYAQVPKQYPLDAAAETKIGSTGLHFKSKTLHHSRPQEIGTKA